MSRYEELPVYGDETSAYDENDRDHVSRDSVRVDGAEHVGLSQPSSRVWTLTSKRLREIGTVELTGLERSALSIGSESADVLLDWPGVATRHVSLELTPSGLALTAHAEKTWINDGPIAPGTQRTVKPGDKITLGPIELYVGEEVVEAADLGSTTPATADNGSLPDTGEWIERAQVQQELRRQLDEVELAAEEQERRLADAEAAVDAAVDEVKRDPDGSGLQDQIEQYRGLVDELKLSLVASTGEALEAHRQRLSDLQQRQSELDALHERIKGRGDALSRREQALTEREQAVEASEQAVQERERSLTETADELATQARDLDQRDQQAWHRERDSERRETELARSETVWQTRLAEVETQQQDLEQQAAAVEAQQQRLSTRGEELEQSEQAIQTRANDVDRRISELETREQQLTTREDSIADQRARIQTERDAVAADRKRLATTHSELDDRLQAIDERAAEIAAQESQLATERLELSQERERLTQNQQRREEQLLQQEAELQERSIAVRNRELAIEMSREELEASGSAAVVANALSNASDSAGDVDDELQQRLTDLTEDEAALDAEREELAAERNHLETQRSDLERREQQLSLRTAEVERSEAESTLEKQRLEKMLSEQESATAEHADREAEQLEALQTEIEGLRAELESERSQAQLERDTIEQDREALRSEREEVDEVRRNLATSEAEVAARASEVEETSSRIAAERDEVERLRSELAEQEQVLEEQRDAFQEEAERHAAEQHEADEDIAAEHIAEESSTASETSAEVDRLLATVADLTAQLAAMEQRAGELEQDAVSAVPGAETPEPIAGNDECTGERGLAAEWAAKLNGSSEEMSEPAETVPKSEFSESEDSTDHDSDPFGSADGPGQAAAVSDNPFEDVDAEADTPDGSVDQVATDEAASATTDLWTNPDVTAGDADELAPSPSPFDDDGSPAEAAADDEPVTRSSDDMFDFFGSSTAGPMAHNNETEIDWGSVSADAESTQSSDGDTSDDTSHTDAADVDSVAANPFAADDVFGEAPEADAASAIDSPVPATSDDDPWGTPNVEELVEPPAPSDELDSVFDAPASQSPPVPEVSTDWGLEQPGHGLSETSLFSSAQANDPVGDLDMPTSDEGEAPNDDVGIRSRLAEMFGVSVDDLSDAAGRHNEGESLDEGDDVASDADIDASLASAMFAPSRGDEPSGDEPNTSPWEQPLTDGGDGNDIGESPSEESDPFATSPFGSDPEPAATDASAAGDSEANPFAPSHITEPDVSAAEASADQLGETQTGDPEAADASPFEALYASESKGETSPVDDLPSFDSFADEPAIDPTAHASRQFEMPAEQAPAAEEQSEDSVAAYMEQLLARSRGGAAEPEAPIAPVVAHETAPAAKPDEPKAPRERQPVDADAIRKEVTSFREVALMSARTAVANSRVKQVRMQLIAKAVATGIGMIVSGVLIASPVWSKESFVTLGFIALAISCVIGYFTWESIKHYQRIMQVTKSKRNAPEPVAQPAGEEVEAAAAGDE